MIGGGTAGLTAALAARHAGADVALVEREERLGGDCAFHGCVPSKALIALARAVDGQRRLEADGVLRATGATGFQAVMAHVREVVETIAWDERDERFADRGIARLRGSATFRSAHELQVGDRIVSARRFVVATGSEPAIPPVDGLEDVPFVTNRTVFDISERPEHLLVLGGGAIGLELAQAFRRLGSKVTVVELLDRLLAADEPEAGRAVLRSLRNEGIDVRLGQAARSARCHGGGVILTLDEEEVAGDLLLVATGRRASVEGLGLETVGIELARGYIKVDRRCRTSLSHVFAAGDVTGAPQLTHVAAHEGSVAGRNAAGRRSRRDEVVVPQVVFTDPEVARAGLTEADARRRHGDVRVSLLPMARVDRARIEQRPDGFVKLVTARRRVLRWLGGGSLVGAQVVGPSAGELINECALAIRTRMFAGRLAQTIHAYPTMGLALQQTAGRLFPLGRALVEVDETHGRGSVARAPGESSAAL